jgi:hypothetical protein
MLGISRVSSSLRLPLCLSVCSYAAVSNDGFTAGETPEAPLQRIEFLPNTPGRVSRYYGT